MPLPGEYNDLWGVILVSWENNVRECRPISALYRTACLHRFRAVAWPGEIDCEVHVYSDCGIRRHVCNTSQEGVRREFGSRIHVDCGGISQTAIGGEYRQSKLL